MFQHVDEYPGDPILSLMEVYNQDKRANKINLSIGLYYDEHGQVPILSSVAKAAERLEAKKEPYYYLPMGGFEPYLKALRELTLGKEQCALHESRMAMIQTVGGSGALRLGADFLQRYFPKSDVWVSSPTWDNHITIFENTGFTVHSYPYFDTKTRGVDINGMQAVLKTLPEKSIVLMHACCHNPTGADLTSDQWDILLSIIEERNLIPFFDIAYQGFSDSLEEDSYAIKAAVGRQLSFFLSSSFSKNFSIYGERCGGLTVFCRDENEAERVVGQLKAGVRSHYSSPPIHGAKIITEVFDDRLLYREWENEVAGMRERIKRMRQALFTILSETLPGQDFSYLIKQRGMFSYTGFTSAQVDVLRERFAIYLVGNGRICLAGVNEGNLSTIAEAFAAVQ